MSLINTSPRSASLRLLGTLLVTCVFFVATYDAFAAGTLEPSFGNNGDASGSGSVSALQADGKIVILSLTYDSSNYYDFTIARYNSNGTPDWMFGRLGRV